MPTSHSVPWRRFAAALRLALGAAISSFVVATAEAEAQAPPPAAAVAPIDFERDVQPILTRFGCNSGACHGKQRGQNGFQLSLLGFDSDFDYASLAKEARGRRIFSPDPFRSLLLEKPLGTVPHGGGKRLAPDSAGARILAQWMTEGATRRVEGTPKLTHVVVSPADRVLAPGSTQQMTVVAHYDDGSVRDVTQLSAYQSSESAIVAVDEHGLLRAGKIMGTVGVMARYLDEIAVAGLTVPLADSVPDDVYAALPRNNFIDGLVWDKLRTLGLTPSDPAPEHAFLRRATIDVVGRTPTLEETRAYLGDASPDRRAKLVDRLLDNPEYAEHWANKWADLLRPNVYHAGIKATFNYDAWIRDAFRRNLPYDRFVKDLLTAQGSSFRNGAIVMFRDRRTPEDLTTIVSQLFLGIRLECAKCHHHPSEVWGQDDFYRFAAYFADVARKGQGIGPPISGGEETVFRGPRKPVLHPLTGQAMSPQPLYGTAPNVEAETDLRVALADWITSSENANFERTMANRVWADLMGRGVVEPVDDLRASNPPSNPALLAALGRDFREQGYDVKKLIRRITASHVYSLSSVPNAARNVGDTRNYSRHYRQRLRAEVLLDSMADVTGVPETFAAMPPQTRAKELWTNRIDSVFLDAFGRPDPNQSPPCERTDETTVVQALHLMNSKNLFGKSTSDAGRVAKLAAGTGSVDEIVEELYLLCYSRPPTDDERPIAREFFAEPGVDRRQAVEDLLWALLNTPEFVFKD